ncbi:hypothetical protein [Glaciibacter superstes]|uniref:hypothetical protein n=1 Tax=Glaciibacter superstes TaxID=501023 RepID=UPI0003B5729F|nr:hypothetical protein [Glaciibacter superstes]
MTTRWARFARGWVVAGISTFVAALSHTFGGGAAPGALAVIVSLAFAGIVCIGLSGRTLSLWRVIISVLTSQLILHGLFSLGAPGGLLQPGTAAAAATATDAAATGAHQHATVTGTLVDGALADGAIASAHAAGSHGASMWLAHLVAAAVTIVALRHGEAAFWSLFANARLVIRSLFAPVLTAIAPASMQRIPNTACVFEPRDLGVLLSTMRHRGPPVISVA